MTALATALPLVSVLLSLAITYWLNVRTRKRTAKESVFHDAIAALAVLEASRDYMSGFAPWDGASAEDYQAALQQVRRDAILRRVSALADARAAVARASAFDPELRAYLVLEPSDFLTKAPEMAEALRKRLG